MNDDIFEEVQYLGKVTQQISDPTVKERIQQKMDSNRVKRTLKYLKGKKRLGNGSV